MLLLRELMSKYCPGAIEFIREHCKEGTPSVDANLLRSFFDLLLAVLTPARGVDPKKAERAPLVKLWFIFAFVWAFGGNLVEESRALFDSHVRSSGMLKELDPSFPETVRRDHAEIIAEISPRLSPRLSPRSICRAHLRLHRSRVAYISA